MKLIKLVKRIFFICILAGTTIYVVNLFTYFDPVSMCYISLSEHVTQGNKDTIKKALKKIKIENQTTYMDVCRYVNKITEIQCIAADPRVEPENYVSTTGGCYVKGSKIIYIDPQEDDNENVVDKRARLIKKYAFYSKQFWE